METSISICFTNFNRSDLLFDAIEPFISDNRISEIVISDDHSDETIFNSVVWKYNGIDKVKVFRNEVNIDCYLNKKRAIQLATNEWCAILDSDNQFDKSFTDTLFSQRQWNKTWAYAPEFARPHFDFTGISGVVLSKNNIASYLNKGNCSTMLNAMNYFINRDEFLRTWGISGDVDPVTSDSLFQNYNWLKGGNSIYVTPGLQYNHRVHDGSHYKQNVKRTAHGFHESIIEKLKNMR